MRRARDGKHCSDLDRTGDDVESSVAHAARLAWPLDHGKKRVGHEKLSRGSLVLQLVRTGSAFESGTMKPPLVAVALLVALSPISQAMFAMPQPVPVDRIVKNTEAKLAKNPEDNETRYQLARVHYLAFALKKDALGAYTRGEKAPTAEHVADKGFQEWITKKLGKLNSTEAISHAGKAAELFQQVIKKDSRHALAHLGFGSLLEQFAEEAVKNPPKDIPMALAQRDGATIRKHYEQAFEQAWKKDRNAKSKGVLGLAEFVSYEAAQSYLRSAKADAGKLTDEEKENVRWMGDAVKKLEALPMGAITPLVFSMRPAASLDALLAPEVAVEFDLRGLGAKERWPWLRADAGVLVWDPEGSGCITSARQMFGSYSWQLFWRDGFEALAALDDNHDGWLRSGELDGISAWFDCDQNAVSDPGEVTPLSALGITGLACAAPERDGPHPLNPRGIELRDGCALPLWDWIVTPLAPSHEGSSLAGRCR